MAGSAAENKPSAMKLGLEIMGEKFSFEFQVSPDLILAKDFLKRKKLFIDHPKDQLVFNGRADPGRRARQQGNRIEHEFLGLLLGLKLA